MSNYDVYDNPLIVRYASRRMAWLWSPQVKFSTWRRLWVALAETHRTLGLNISAEQIEALRSQVETIDFAAAEAYERRFRHDVMAHIHALGDAAPVARPIIHLGATSCFVTDNTDLILIREALDLLRDQLVAVIDGLAHFALRWKDLPCLIHPLPAGPARDRGQAGDALVPGADPRPVGNRAPTLRAQVSGRQGDHRYPGQLLGPVQRG